MKGVNRWIMLACIVLAGIAVALDHVSHQRPNAEAQDGAPLPEQPEAGGYGTASDDSEDE